MLKRHKIPKYEDGEFWHWKDLAVGKNIVFYGIVFHMVDCDVFTREYMASQGLIMADAEQLPPDPYTQNRLLHSQQNNFTKTPSADDKFRRFLEYDGKILKSARLLTIATITHNTTFQVQGNLGRQRFRIWRHKEIRSFVFSCR